MNIIKLMDSQDLFEEEFREEAIIEYGQKLLPEHHILDGAVDEIECNYDVENKISTLSEKVEFCEKETLKNDLNINSGAALHEKLFKLPMTRVRNLMKLDPDLHIASNEAVFAVTRSAEMFIESLARESFSYTAQAKKKTIQKRDVELAICAVDSLIFLDGAMSF